jgi:hypothetical protein
MRVTRLPSRSSISKAPRLPQRISRHYRLFYFSECLAAAYALLTATISATGLAHIPATSGTQFREHDTRARATYRMKAE